MIPRTTRLNFPKLIDAARRLSQQGKTMITDNHLFCLDVDDAYIHQLFPLLEDAQIQKPKYFDENSVGAHITIIYPEESKHIRVDDLQKECRFFVKDIVAAEIGHKIYYVLLIESLSLLKLRQAYKLPDLLSFKGYLIGFHITIGVKII